MSATSARSAAPQVSVVIPVRNRRDLLRRCLDALAAQTGGVAYEIVVVDDGSTDGADREAQADADAGRPVRVLRGPAQGAVAARIAGVAVARAPFLAFTDSDCEPSPGWLAAGLAALSGGAALAYGPVHPARAVRPFERSLAAGEEGLFPTANVFYRRSAFEEAGGFATDLGARLGFRPGRTLSGTGFGEDTLLAWRVIRTGGRVDYLADAVVTHHVFPADAAESLRRAWAVGAFPGLVAEVPELRHRLLHRGLFLGPPARLPLYLAVMAGLVRRPRLTLIGLAAWVATGSAAPRAAEPLRRRLLWEIPAHLGLETVSAVALVVGSIRAREVVL